MVTGGDFGKADQDGSTSYFTAILEHTPNGVLLVDGDTKIRYVNPSFRKMFHCEGGQLLGRDAAAFVHCDCFERAIAAGGHLMVKESIPDHKISFR
ncbi:MAG: PAS domain-containing protein, partial [Spirochaetales bacterium]|nr:PAS domain-containing protein [Spirochaetales bacterium]